MLKRIDMKNKERIAILESEISRLKVANRNNIYRIEQIESHLAEQHKGANFSKLNSSEIPNTCEPITPNFIPDWKDAPEDAVCVAMDGNGYWFWWRFMPTINTTNAEWNTMPNSPGDGLTHKDWEAGKATNAYLLPPDYWKSTLMMRPDAVKDYTHLLPEGYEFCEEGDHDDWVKVKIIPSDDYAKKIEIGSLLMGKFCWDKFKPYYRPIRKSAPDYSHLLPEGYEFCSEQDAEKWVKVEMLDAEGENELGFVVDGKQCCNKPHYRPIRPIQYKVTTHEIVDAIPDPYMPDWSQAPEGTVAHAWDEDGSGFWCTSSAGGKMWEFGYISSPFTLPADLDWKQSLRVKPN
jgi:hypothetical protein